MINYELAKELKDAGFPQNLVSPLISPRRFERGTESGQEEYVFFPELSELIDACEPEKADEFCLDLHTDPWEAIYIYVGYFEGWPAIERDEDGAVEIRLKVQGFNPEQAVAKLWLALNKK